MRKACKEKIYKQNRRENINNLRRNRRNLINSMTIHNKNICDSPIQHYLGQMNIFCKYCNAKHFVGEQIIYKKNSFNDCCSHGTVTAASFVNFPTEL